VRKSDYYSASLTKNATPVNARTDHPASIEGTAESVSDPVWNCKAGTFRQPSSSQSMKCLTGRGVVFHSAARFGVNHSDSSRVISNDDRTSRIGRSRDGRAGRDTGEVSAEGACGITGVSAAGGSCSPVSDISAGGNGGISGEAAARGSSIFSEATRGAVRRVHDVGAGREASSISYEGAASEGGIFCQRAGGGSGIANKGAAGAGRGCGVPSVCAARHRTICRVTSVGGAGNGSRYSSHIDNRGSRGPFNDASAVGGITTSRRTSRNSREHRT